ncbi:hypothetical protein [Actinacidiphila acididurans]|uniref:Uncharacterized protein n=1 Tax=Actinacidiphila acididurans TaxID=2784346 RepID=A0ABS2U4Q5_9ACTN|nr:hypothetical protein [Actinacidiphila acididurans]MBM9509977.1 hypothetical protein [Actinacidiphila acididurans]
MKRHGKNLIAELKALGFDYIWTNSSGAECYVHPGDAAQTQVTVSASIGERAARDLLARARKLAGATTPDDNKRNAAQVKDRAAASRQRLQEARDARERLLAARASAAEITRAELLVAEREAELALIERLMVQPAQGGNAHRGRGQARHRAGRRP